MSIITATNLSKSYRVHEKQQGIKNTVKDLFNRKYVYKEAVINLNMTIEKGVSGFLFYVIAVAAIKTGIRNYSSASS